MNKKEAIRQTELMYRLNEHGFSDAEFDAMRRCSTALSHWCELECNGEIERTTGSGRPERVAEYQSCGGNWTRHHYFIPDRESGAIKRMDRIIAAHPGWTWYYQTDPRGVAVYLYRTDDDRLKDYPIESIYSSIGIAIY